MRSHLEQILFETAAGAIGADSAFLFADADARVGDHGRILTLCTDFFELFGLSAHECVSLAVFFR